MGNESSIVFSGIAPHPPIMVPEVGRESSAEVRGSIAAMAEMTRRIISCNAETVVLISPHAPLEPNAFVAYQGPNLHADFANFRAPEVQLDFPLDIQLLDAIKAAAAAENYEVVDIDDRNLDHGTGVPLYFLQRNGWQGGVVSLGYSFLSNEDHLRFGSCISKAIKETGRSVAIIASGDLSHRLTPDAPAGFNPTAYIFDDEVVDAVRSNSPDRIIKIDQDLRKLAGECGYRSMLVAIGATLEVPLACKVLHYEAPFGVGYLVAQLTCRKAVDEGGSLPALARATIESFVLTGKAPDAQSNPSDLLNARAACFVSLKTLDGQLRGCIGTIEPAKDTLAEEVVANAINAASRDPRFLPVSADELPNLKYSVDVLAAPEPAKMEDLDPAIYGVIVEDESGLHRGLLLPDIEGVDSVERQVEIAARKAGIASETPLKLWRFRVSRFKEQLSENPPSH